MKKYETCIIGGKSFFIFFMMFQELHIGLPEAHERWENIQEIFYTTLQYMNYP